MGREVGLRSPRSLRLPRRPRCSACTDATSRGTSNSFKAAGQVQSPVVLCSYTLMSPTLVREPFHRSGWVYEEKVDGWRIVAYKDRDRVRLVSRNGVDHTRRFADLAA